MKRRLGWLLGIAALLLALTLGAAFRPVPPRIFALLNGKPIRLVASREMDYPHGSRGTIPFMVRYYEVRAPYAAFHDALVREVADRRAFKGYFEQDRSVKTTWHESGSGAALIVWSRTTSKAPSWPVLDSRTTGFVMAMEPVRDRFWDRVEDGIEQMLRR